MTALWIATLTGWLLALVAFVLARRLSRRVAQLNELYWQLKYDYTELRSRVKALEPTEEPPGAGPPIQQSFVPLSSLKRQ
jgi:hypothetical protein